VELQRSQELGRQILESELLPYDLHLETLIENREFERLASRYKFADYRKLFQEIGFGKFPASKVISKLVPPGQLRRVASRQARKKKERAATQAQEPKKKEKAEADKPPEARSETGIIIEGMDSPLVQLADCCRPLPGEDIVAFTEEDRGVIVHRANCSKVVDLNPDRRVPARWAQKVKGIRTATIEVISMDRPGLLAEMSGAIAASRGDITQALARTTADQKAIDTFEIKIKNARHLQRIIKKLEKIKGVISVKRIPG
jgi:guanosine-3',5'-bis(diphosphate) 3'-pyrophosphohydrolase